MTAHKSVVESEEAEKLASRYVLAGFCSGCGTVPLYIGHQCWASDDGGFWAEDRCPACGKVLGLWRSGKSLRSEERCDCSELPCPFCRECCALLSAPASLQ